MQERVSALAIGMRFSSKSRQIPPQLVVQALDVVRMRLAYGVLLRFDDGLIGRMCIRAVMDMSVCR